MGNLGLEHGKSNNGVQHCCYSCLKGEIEGTNNRIRCDKGTLMNPNEHCDDFSIDSSRTSEEVVDFVKDFINKNSGI